MPKFISILTVFVCLFFLVFPCFGDDNKERLTFEYFLNKAENGEPEAQYGVGLSYFRGRFDGHEIEQNYEEAAKWLKLAANTDAWGSGHSAALLGHIYENGLETPVNADEALKWYNLSAEKGSAVGFMELGRIYLQGKIVPQNDELGFFYSNNAARLGVAKSQMVLAAYYYNGWHVEQDLAKAWFWANFALTGPDSKIAKEEVSDLMGGLWENINAAITPKQLAAAQKLTLKNIDGINVFIGLPYEYFLGLFKRDIVKLERSPLLHEEPLKLVYDTGEIIGLDTQLTMVFFEKTLENDSTYYSLNSFKWNFALPKGSRTGYINKFNEIRKAVSTKLGWPVSDKLDKNGQVVTWHTPEYIITMYLGPEKQNPEFTLTYEPAEPDKL